jgi:hypothetical protein
MFLIEQPSQALSAYFSALSAVLIVEKNLSYPTMMLSCNLVVAVNRDDNSKNETGTITRQHEKGR